jgi:hypothetical protein
MKDRTGNIIVSIALVLGVTLPGFISTYVSAAQVTTRSITLGSSSKGSTGVEYDVQFTAPTAAAAYAILFCSNSPLPGVACTAPTGFDASGALTATSGYTMGTKTANSVVIGHTIGAGDTITDAITAINNPAASGPLYARISTYASTGAADTDMANTSSNAGADQGTAGIDNGSVAISITDSIGVSGAVLESLVFCVSKASITDQCLTTTAPILKLGEAVGNTVALVPGTVSTGDIYTLLSTNAASGAVVNLKSSTSGCGGLVRVGAANCDILPALLSGIDGTTDTTAKFGVKVAAGTDLGGSNGIFQVYPASGYSSSAYALNYASGDATGVTSPFGDPILNTAGAPANGKEMKLTFGVNVTNQTPAGLYSADLGLIATGKF